MSTAGRPPSDEGALPSGGDPGDSAFAEFAQAYVKRLPDDLVEGIPDDQLHGQVRSLFEFADAAEISGGILEIDQLAGTRHPGMGRQNLLDQRRAGARHAHHENRELRRVVRTRHD